MRKFLKALWRTFLALLLGSSLISGAAAAIAKASGKATFTAETNALFSVDGEPADVWGPLANDNGTVSGAFDVNLADVRTGDKTRDGHLRELLDVKKHPKVSFVMRPSKTAGSSFPVTGKFTLKGVTRDEVGEASWKAGKLLVKLTIKLTDYGIEPPFLGPVKVKDRVEINVILD